MVCHRMLGCCHPHELADKRASADYYRYPSEHWLKLKINNPMERLLNKVPRRTRVVGALPDGHSVLLVSAGLRHVSATNWGLRKYMNMKLLEMMNNQAVSAD